MLLIIKIQMAGGEMRRVDFNKWDVTAIYRYVCDIEPIGVP